MRKKEREMDERIIQLGKEIENKMIRGGINSQMTSYAFTL